MEPFTEGELKQAEAMHAAECQKRAREFEYLERSYPNTTPPHDLYFRCFPIRSVESFALEIKTKTEESVMI